MKNESFCKRLFFFKRKTSNNSHSPQSWFTHIFECRLTLNICFHLKNIAILNNPVLFTLLTFHNVVFFNGFKSYLKAKQEKRFSFSKYLENSNLSIKVTWGFYATKTMNIIYRIHHFLDEITTIPSSMLPRWMFKLYRCW